MTTPKLITPMDNITKFTKQDLIKLHELLTRFIVVMENKAFRKDNEPPAILISSDEEDHLSYEDSGDDGITYDSDSHVKYI